MLRKFWLVAAAIGAFIIFQPTATNAQSIVHDAVRGAVRGAVEGVVSGAVEGTIRGMNGCSDTAPEPKPAPEPKSVPEPKTAPEPSEPIYSGGRHPID